MGVLIFVGSSVNLGSIPQFQLVGEDDGRWSRSWLYQVFAALQLQVGCKHGSWVALLFTWVLSAAATCLLARGLGPGGRHDRQRTDLSGQPKVKTGNEIDRN